MNGNEVSQTLIEAITGRGRCDDAFLARAIEATIRASSPFSGLTIGQIMKTLPNSRQRIRRVIAASDRFDVRLIDPAKPYLGRRVRLAERGRK